jgi:hypothetical protein
MPWVRDVAPWCIPLDCSAHHKEFWIAENIAGFQMRHEVIQHPACLWIFLVKLSQLLNWFHFFPNLIQSQYHSLNLAMLLALDGSHCLPIDSSAERYEESSITSCS